jgi:hypothetical protein
MTSGLNKNGYNTFTFNFSENTGGIDIEHQVKDVAQIVEHFKEYKEIILLAGSFAALTAAIATIQIPRVKGLITLNGFFGESRLGREHRRNYMNSFQNSISAKNPPRRLQTVSAILGRNYSYAWHVSVTVFTHRAVFLARKRVLK